MTYISREEISFSKCWDQLQNRRWKASVFILRLVFFTKVHILCYFVHGITNPYDYKNRGSIHIDSVSHSPGWRSADDVTMDCRWRQKCITRYNRNTLLLLDTVRQTFRGKSAAWGRPRPLTSRGMSAWPYRVTTKYYFYPVRTYKMLSKK